jgi:hypothetical protein
MGSTAAYLTRVIIKLTPFKFHLPTETEFGNTTYNLQPASTTKGTFLQPTQKIDKKHLQPEICQFKLKQHNSLCNMFKNLAIY